jgi:hypothetical protein
MKDRKEIERSYKFRDRRERDNLMMEVLLDIRELLQRPAIVVNQAIQTSKADFDEAFRDALEEMRESKKSARQTDGKIV